ncbi:hypothetical protein JQ615_41425 [Bradyrhizobium jicamae]|uniref:Calcium-binding protein n=1 Tax=Bradyrhizobium jicamae TaxID=280332 RepID=A0ABS5FY84_9BRAD|nr:calcium-binding protein [Bradyrhizobium jicamae]MBR0801798.1 hypothetical protein [Bradyrhizobium jicamae]
MTDFYGATSSNPANPEALGGYTNYYADSGNAFMWGSTTGNQDFFGGAGNSVMMTSGGTYTGNGTLSNPDEYVISSFVPSTGNDVFFGGTGNDAIYAAYGNDTVFGGTGNLSGAMQGLDGIYFEAGIFGGNGNDFFYAGSGNDSIWAGNGNDVFYAGSGSDLIVGGNGNDVFYGGSGQSTMYGGTGNDIYIGGSGLSYEVGATPPGGLGPGSVNYFYLSSATGSEAYGAEGGTNVFVAGTNGSVMIGRGGGNDFMYAEGGNNYFYGGDNEGGTSEFFGGSGVDVMIGDSYGNSNYFDGGTGVNYYFGGSLGITTNTFNVSLGGGDVIQDWLEGNHDVVQLNGTGWSSFSDILAHSYQNGAYFVVQVNPETAVWLNGATASSINANDFKIAS